MLKIRLQRVGRTNDPSFRVVLVDSHEGPKTGKVIEILGAYNPKTKQRNVDEERVKYWMQKGARVSDTLHNMLVSLGVITGKKINVLPRKTPIVKESGPADTQASSTPAADTSEPPLETSEENTASEPAMEPTPELSTETSEEEQTAA